MNGWNQLHPKYALLLWHNFIHNFREQNDSMWLRLEDGMLSPELYLYVSFRHNGFKAIVHIIVWYGNSVLNYCYHLAEYETVNYVCVCVQGLFQATQCAARGTAPVSTPIQEILRSSLAWTVYPATRYKHTGRQTDNYLMRTFAVILIVYFFLFWRSKFKTAKCMWLSTKRLVGSLFLLPVSSCHCKFTMFIVEIRAYGRFGSRVCEG